jgi:hypothetical protein
MYRTEISIVPKLNREFGFELGGRNAMWENAGFWLTFPNDKEKASKFLKGEKQNFSRFLDQMAFSSRDVSHGRT